MRKFKDKEGIEWEITIDFSSALAIKQEVGVDILDIAEGKDLVLLSSDIATLGAVFWVLLQEQAKTREIADEKALFRRFNGDVLDEATKCLIAECFDFFPPAKRSLLKAAYEKLLAAEAQSLASAQTTLDQMSAEEFGKLATGLASDLKSLAPSASTPGGTPSGN